GGETYVSVPSTLVGGRESLIQPLVDGGVSGIPHIGECLEEPQLHQLLLDELISHVHGIRTHDLSIVIGHAIHGYARLPPAIPSHLLGQKIPAALSRYAARCCAGMAYCTGENGHSNRIAPGCNVSFSVMVTWRLAFPVEGFVNSNSSR